MAFNIDQLVIFAARSGNLPLLQERLAAGGNVNHVDPRFGSALAAAVGYANLPVVEWLLQHGADPNLEDPYGNGPLVVALHHHAPRSSNASSTVGLASGRSRVHTGSISSNSV